MSDSGSPPAPPGIKRKRRANWVAEMRISGVPGAAGKGRAHDVRFGSVILRGYKADPTEIAHNVAKGRAALKGVAAVLTKPGVKLKRIKGVPLYSVDPIWPDHLVRNVDGKRERGIFKDGQFKVTG